MTPDTQPSRNATPGWLLGVLLVTAVAAQSGRILSVRSSTGEVPFHSANDRSRWCGVAALGGYGQFEIDPFLEIRDPKTKRKTWSTIDLVRHRGRDGKQHYYSSKPPLLTTLHAAVYAAVRSLTGLSLLKETFTTARIILLIVNLLPLALFWWVWGKYWSRQGLSEWAFAVTITFMLWGTFVSTFANTLNNHLPGALAAGTSLWAVLKIVEDRQHHWRWFVLAGIASAFCAACELPALSWAAAVAVLLVQVNIKRAIVGLAAGMLPIAIAFAVVNYLAHGDLKPPYAHRAVGEFITSIEHKGTVGKLEDATTDISEAVRKHGYSLSNKAVIRPTRTPDVMELWDEATQYRFAVKSDVTRPDQSLVNVYQWDDWYDYPNSYWYPDRKQGVDKGELNRATYLFQTTLGHHGVFSLTPIWLLLPLGMWTIWQRSLGPTRTRVFHPQVQVMLAIVTTSLVCFTFYMMRPLEDRNYGGVSCGFRWMFWFTPLWCWLLAHGLNRVRTRWSRRIAIAALAISIFSATFPWANPWTSPWLWTLFRW